jgi:hypothetical protein
VWVGTKIFLKTCASPHTLNRGENCDIYIVQDLGLQYIKIGGKRVSVLLVLKEITTGLLLRK